MPHTAVYTRRKRAEFEPGEFSAVASVYGSTSMPGLGLMTDEEIEAAALAKKTIKKGKSPMWANFNCETFWYDGGDCDELNEQAVNVQMVAKQLTSAPALAVGALAVVALVAAKARRSSYAEL